VLDIRNLNTSLWRE